MSLQDILSYFHRGTLISSRTECFVRVEGSRSYAQLTFINNTAGIGGDVLYGGLLALGYDGDWNCLLSFKNISDMSQQNGLSLISSTPSRVCLCNKIGQPDCLTVADPTTRVIYPGQTITIPAVVVGQDFGTVTGSQLFHTIDSVHMEQKQYNIAVQHSQCSNHKYTIFSQSEESAAVLVLTHDNRDISHLMNEEDNQKRNNTWEILNKMPNYKTLAKILYVTSLISPTLGISLLSQNCLVIVQLKTSINSPSILAEKIQYTQNFYSPRKSTAILFTLKFPSVLVPQVSLSQKIRHSDVIATTS